MAIANHIKTALGTQSAIRKMFEEGGILKKQYGSENVFDFSLGNPDLEPPPAFEKTLLRLAADKTPGVHGYMPNAGFPDVRSGIAKKVSRDHNVNITFENIVMSVGAAGAMNTVMKSILNPGDEVIALKPYFMEYRAYVSNHGGKIVEANTNEDFTINVDAIKNALSKNTAALIINSPNNPSGVVYSKEDIAKIADTLSAHGKSSGRYPVLIADEPYRELVYDGVAAPPVLSAYKNSVVCTSYSKNLSLPGERIGYVAINPSADDAADFTAAVIYATRILGFVNAPALMQRAVAELTNENVSVDIQVYNKRRLAFKKVLDDANIKYAEPEGAFYIFAKVPPRKNSSGEVSDGAFVEHLKKFLILGVGGSGFASPGWLRFAYCISDEHITKSAGAFKKAMQEW